MYNINKKILISWILFIVIGLLSCTTSVTTTQLPTETTEHKPIQFSNHILDWDDVEGAIYYRIRFYYEDGTIWDNMYEYTYVSELDMAMNYSLNLHYYIKIKSFFQNGDSEETELLDFRYRTIFEYPNRLSMDLSSKRITWSSNQYKSGFQNYTLRINDEEYSTEYNYYDYPFEPDTVYEISVRSNYTLGRSDFTKPYVYREDSTKVTEHFVYPIYSIEDVILEFEQDEEIISMQYINHSMHSGYVELPQGAYEIEGSTVTINHIFMINNLKVQNPFLLFIITDKDMYIYTYDLYH